MSKGLLIVVSSPSGGGKGTILGEYFKCCGHDVKYSVSATTRAPREGEIDGEHYHFITKKEFVEMIDAGEMLEYAEYCDNYYGTPKAPVHKALDKGTDVLLEIEVKGGAQIKALEPECVSIFITPPSLEVLEKRLRGRQTETEDKIKLRLETAKEEMECAKDYDHVIVNDILEKAVEDFIRVIEKEREYR